VAIDTSVRYQQLVRECGISFLANPVTLSPLHQLCNNLLFVPPDFQVVTVDEGCSMVNAIESTNVLRWLNVILDLNGVLCSCVQKSTVTRWGPQ
jgi:hypothetical protein